MTLNVWNEITKSNNSSQHWISYAIRYRLVHEYLKIWELKEFYNTLFRVNFCDDTTVLKFHFQLNLIYLMLDQLMSTGMILYWSLILKIVDK